jgi:hypothetical protein
MTTIAGIDVGNATTEIVIVDGRVIVCAGRAPTRGAKGSPESLRGAAVLLRRLERQAGLAVTQARIAPLRPVDTLVRVVPDVPPPIGRLRVLAAGVATPGGRGACVGVPLLLPPVPGTGVSQRSQGSGRDAAGHGGHGVTVGSPVVVLVPAELGYTEAAARIAGLLAAGVRVGAILVARDEGVLIANRLPGGSAATPVIDQVDVPAAARCSLLAVEVRPPGHPLTVAADPVALGAAFGPGELAAGDLARLSRGLLDHSNAVVGLASDDSPADSTGHDSSGHAGAGPPGAAAMDAVGAAQPWVLLADGRHIALRAAARQAAGWAPGTARALRTADATTQVDDLFAVDLAEVASAATARRGSTGRAIVVAVLTAQSPADRSAASELSVLLSVPVSSPATEPAAARLGAATTPGMAPGALVADIGSGTIDVITPQAEAVVAGAGDLLTAAVARTLDVPRAAADWIKRGPCIRVDGTARYEAEDGTRGFLAGPAPPAAAGMLAVAGPGGLLPFGSRGNTAGGHLGPAEWRAMRLRLKQAILAASLRRALDAAGRSTRTEYPDGRPAQLLLVGGPAGDDELVGVLARSLPEELAIGRGNVGGTLEGGSLGHRYAVALGLALARPGAL